MASKANWGAKMVVPPDFMKYAIDRGELLAYAAERAIELINKRTDAGLDANGSPFAPHPPRVEVVRRDGEIVRGAGGRWTETVLSTRPVDLRGLTDVSPGRRMRDNLRFSPAFPRPDQRIVWISPQGSRQRPRRRYFPLPQTRSADTEWGFDYVQESVRHAQVAAWNQNGHPGHGVKANGQRYNFTVPARRWVDLTQADKAKLWAELRQPPPTAWLDTRRKQRVAFYLKKAQNAETRMRRLKKKGDEARAAKAYAAHQKFVAELTRVGGQYTERIGKPRGRKPRASGR